jgi:hypothetical protein
MAKKLSLWYSGVASTPTWTIRDERTGLDVCEFVRTTTRTAEDVSLLAKTMAASPQMAEALKSIQEWSRDSHDMPQDPLARCEWYARRLMLISNTALVPFQGMGSAAEQILPMQKAIKDLEDTFGTEHPKHNRIIHGQEVDDGKGKSSIYWEWVVGKLQDEDLTVEEVVIAKRFEMELESGCHSSADSAYAAASNILGATGWASKDHRYQGLSDALSELCGSAFTNPEGTPSMSNS